MAWLQVYGLPQYFEFGSPWIWVIATIIGLVLGAAIGSVHGTIIAYSGIPSFIVTLGGLLFWRGAAFKVASGETIAPMDATYLVDRWRPLWFHRFILELDGRCSSLCWHHLGYLFCPHQRQRFKFPLRPIWAELTVGRYFLRCRSGHCSLGQCLLLAERHYQSVRHSQQHHSAARRIVHCPWLCHPCAHCHSGRPGHDVYCHPHRFGRYIYAIGGNPEAAELAGINTKKITIATFTIMGVLCAISAIIATARLNAAAIALGTTDELYVIAAAVIGGTSLSGGAGTIFGAFFGALIMQSIQTGMTLLGFDTPVLNMTLGLVSGLCRLA